MISANRIQNNEVSSAGQSFGAGATFYMMDASNRLCGNNIYLNYCSGDGSGKGGGVYMFSSCMSSYNNILNNNRSTYGGGFYLNGDPSRADMPFAVFFNNTIVSNTCKNAGGGLFARNSRVLIINSIIWNNFAVDDPGIAYIRLAPDVRYSNVQNGKDTNGNICTDPLFANSLPYFELSDESPCIGTGINTIQIDGMYYYCPECCFHGNPRPSPEGSMPDMGACEHLSGLTGLSTFENIVPQIYTLKQNYPNPFNPETTIEFTIPNSEFVTLIVYNSLGQEMVTLVSENLSPGSYVSTWDASQFASGAYYYKIEAGNYIAVKKLILMK